MQKRWGPRATVLITDLAFSREPLNRSVFKVAKMARFSYSTPLSHTYLSVGILRISLAPKPRAWQLLQMAGERGKNMPKILLSRLLHQAGTSLDGGIHFSSRGQKWTSY